MMIGIELWHQALNEILPQFGEGGKAAGRTLCDADITVVLKVARLRSISLPFYLAGMLHA